MFTGEEKRTPDLCADGDRELERQKILSSKKLTRHQLQEVRDKEDRELYACEIGVVFTASNLEEWAFVAPYAYIHTRGFADVVELLIARQKKLKALGYSALPDDLIRASSSADAELLIAGRKGLVRTAAFVILDGVSRQEAGILASARALHELRILVVKRTPEDFCSARLMNRSAWDIF